MKYTYKGNGEFFPGIPARDLDDKDLSAEQKAIVEKSKLYGTTKEQPNGASKPQDEGDRSNIE